MRANCIQAVEQAIGRPITQAESVEIERRILRNMRSLAAADPQGWRSKGSAQRLSEAAAQAATQLLGEAQAKQIRVAQAAAAQARWLGVLATAKASGTRQADAVFAELERVDRYRKGVERDYFRQLVDAVDAIDGKLLGLIEDAAVAKAVVDEIFGRSTGSVKARAAAKAWLETAEAMRVRFNASGGDMGKLDYSYLPQPHDQVRVLKAGQQAWVDDTLPLLDRARYYNEDGTPFTDPQMRAMLEAAWETISSGGVNKQTPGAFRGTGAGITGNPAAKTREIHFAGPDEYMAYQQAYGRGSVLGSMRAHVGRMAKDIALAESLGPNWQQTFKVTRDTMRKDGVSTRTLGATIDVEQAFGTLTGQYQIPAHAQFASIAQGARNIEVAAKLGGAVLSSVTDVGTIMVTAGFHRLPMHTLAANVIRSFGAGTADYANRAGLMADSLISDMNRWAEGNIGAGWTGKLANATMKLSLMNAWTDSLRRGFSVTMMGGMGRLSRIDWGQLDATDRARLERAGISSADWAVVRLATPEQWRGQEMLTPESIRAVADPSVTDAQKNAVAAKVLGFVVDESEYAVVNPDLATRTIQQGGTQKGTATGELWRSAMLFKSFPVAMITRHWRRTFDETLTPAGRMAYGAALLTALTTMGYVAMSLKDMARGKDPKDTTDARTWGAAFIQGGGVGILGDFLFSTQNRFGGGLGATLAGPLLGDAITAAELGFGAIANAAKGEAPDGAAKALRLGVGVTPGASLWYARAALERAVLHDLQEYLSPGYLSRMQARAQKDFNQRYWWEPGQMEPSRPPDMSKAWGGQ